MEQERPAMSRLLAVLTKGKAASGPANFARTVGQEFHAEAVCFQVRNDEGRLLPIGTYARSRGVRDLVQRVAQEGLLSVEASTEHGASTSSASKADRAANLNRELPGLPPDCWMRSIPFRDHVASGLFTIIGSPGLGCSSISEEEAEVLSNFCSLTLAVEAQTRRAVQLERRFEFQTKIGESLASRTTIVERLKVAVEATQKATQFDSIQLITWDPTGHKLLLNVLYIRGSGFLADATWDRMTRDEIEASSQRFLKDPSAMIIPDPADLENVPGQHRTWMIENGIRFLAFVPLIFEDEHLGTLVLTSHFSKKRTEERVRGLTTLGGHLAAILRLSLLLAQVEESYQRLLLPTRALVRTANRLSDGDLGARTGLAHDRGELAQLARTFDEMAERLERQEEERQLKEQGLRQTLQDLEIKTNELEAFTYSVSHDLKEPLRTIEAFSQFLLEDCEDQLDAQGRDYLVRMGSAAARMKQMIEELLTLSRLARRPDGATEVNIAEVLDNIMLTLQEAAQERGALVEVEQGLPPVAGDLTRIEQIFGNLITNALKFGGAEPPRVFVRVHEIRGPMVVFCVRDNGIGIAPEYHEQVFGVFERLHRREEYEGTGAGLAIVKKASEALGGRVWLESSPGAGSTFFVELPRWQEAAAPSLLVGSARN